jgi:hypothetical protein
VLLYGVMRMPVAPQYFFGTFAVTCCSPGSASTSLSRLRVGWVAIGVYGLSVAFITLASTAKIHREGYGRAFPRPSLRNQVQVARELNRYADASVLTDVDIYKIHPQSIRTLRLLLPRRRANRSRPAAGSSCATAPAGREATAPSKLAELPPGQHPGERFEPLDVTPLPPDWHPAKW